jgi:hypothetical protein
LLLTRAGGYVLEVKPESVDIACFECAVAEGEEALADGRPADAAGRLRHALALWRGPALVDFAYESFAQDEIARLDELRLAARSRTASRRTLRSAATGRWSPSSSR